MSINNKQHLKHFVVSLRFSILLIFVTLFVVAMLSMIATNYFRMKESITKLSFSLMHQASHSAFEKITRELEHIVVKSKEAERLISSGILNPEHFDEFLLFSRNILRYETALFPNLHSIIWIDTLGDLVMSARQDNGGIFSIVMDNRTKPFTQTTIYHDINGRVINKVISHQMLFDPRAQFGFQTGKKINDTIWTGPRPFKTIELYKGIGTVTPVKDKNGHFIGVLEFNVRLDYLTQLIESIKLSEHSLIFIVTDQAQVIAFPHLVQYRNPNFINIQGLISYPWVIKSFQMYQSNHKAEFIFTFNGQYYLASYEVLVGIAQSKWFIGVVVPMSDFIGELQKTQIITSIVSFIILIVGIILVSYLISRVVQPMNKITRQIDEIKNFDLSDEEQIESRIKEIDYMGEALASMKKGLRSFQRYVPAALVRQLIESGEDARIGGIKKSLAILFTDIQNFTSIAEHADTEELSQHICHYFNELSNIIVVNNGTIDKYIGDSIMAFWGAPYNDEYACQHAARAALQCVKRLNELNAEWSKLGKPILITRFGLHMGEAIVGNLGSAERLNYTAIGDAINIASRLEGMNKIYKTHIIVSDDVYQIIKDQFVLRMLDLVALKGKAEPSYLYELIAETRHEISYDIDSYMTNFARGFKAYQLQAWDEAIYSFKLCINIYPDDMVAPLFIKRCEQFKTMGKLENWHGVSTY